LANRSANRANHTDVRRGQPRQRGCRLSHSVFQYHEWLGRSFGARNLADNARQASDSVVSGGTRFQPWNLHFLRLMEVLQRQRVLRLELSVAGSRMANRIKQISD